MFAASPHFFDGNGVFSHDARFEIFGLTWSYGGIELGVLDHQSGLTQTFSIPVHLALPPKNHATIDCWLGPAQSVSDQDSTGQFLSSDPLKQVILNAVKKLLGHTPQDPNFAELLAPGPVCQAILSIELEDEASLDGWNLPYEDLQAGVGFGPTTWPLVASGLSLIR
jgi:hypothetical protein